MHQRLKDFGDFDVADGHYLTGERATCKAIRKAISDLFWQTDSCDLALFYFSGHGFVDSRQNGYIAPYDMLKDEPLVCGINMEELKELILCSENKSSIVVILDCCYSGITTKGAKGGEYKTFAFEPYFGNLDKEKGGEGKIILASSGETEVSREIPDCKHKHDDGGPPHPHGTFTFHLIEGLDGNASNETGIITLDRLRCYVEEQLGKQKPKFFAAGASQIERIRIAKSPEKHNKYIQNYLEDSERLYAQKDLASLIAATKKISVILDINAKNTEALKLKNKIHETLIEYQDKVTYWKTMSEQDVRPSIPNAFPKIEKLDYYLDFDKIIALDQEKNALLLLLWKVSKNDIDNKEFIKRCKPFDNPPTTSTQVTDAHK